MNKNKHTPLVLGVNQGHQNILGSVHVSYMGLVSWSFVRLRSSECCTAWHEVRSSLFDVSLEVLV